MNFLKRLFGSEPKPSVSDLIAKGAVIIDVRTEGEYRQGHLKKSVNIPLNILPDKLNNFDKSKPVITVCASGMRSASAKRLLLSNGFTEVVNGGSWTSLRKFE